MPMLFWFPFVVGWGVLSVMTDAAVAHSSPAEKTD